jgi:hypothetical protein
LVGLVYENVAYIFGSDCACLLDDWTSYIIERGKKRRGKKEKEKEKN